MWLLIVNDFDCFIFSCYRYNFQKSVNSLAISCQGILIKDTPESGINEGLCLIFKFFFEARRMVYTKFKIYAI